MLRRSRLASSSPYGISLALLVASTACRGGGGGTGGAGGDAAGGDGQGGLSDATSLECPFPGKLPFALESSGFQNPDAQTIAENNPRLKDEATDILGVPGGVNADTLTEVNEQAAADPLTYAGRKSRTGNASGLSGNPLGGENVSLWYYDSAATSWISLGRAVTDDTGFYTITPGDPVAAPLGQPIYSVLEADKSCTEHFDYLMPSGTKIILTDIDGTLTLSDEELFKQIDDGTYVPIENNSASEMMNLWSDKGYEIVYLTARPHNFRSETRAWLVEKGYPTGPVISANTLVFDESARDYKSAWVTRLTDAFGWEIVAAYGNAESDVQAYEDAGIGKDITFIVGPFAGSSGTQSIENNDYGDHISDFVTPYPDAN
jgi:hypothetical protein